MGRVAGRSRLSAAAVSGVLLLAATGSTTGEGSGSVVVPSPARTDIERFGASYTLGWLATMSRTAGAARQGTLAVGFGMRGGGVSTLVALGHASSASNTTVDVGRSALRGGGVSVLAGLARASSATGATITESGTAVSARGASIVASRWPNGMDLWSDHATAKAAGTSITVAHEEVPFELPTEGSVYATTLVDELAVHGAPSAASELVASLSPWSYYGKPRTVKVLDHAATPNGDWLEVLLPIQPNGTTGWVRLDDVEIGTTTVEIRVDLDTRTVAVFDDGEQLIEQEAVIGHPATPTPPGTYYITDPVDLRVNPDGVYGAYVLGLSGHSEVLETFLGGPPQLAIHGTPRPDQMGQAISNGCIRVPNDVVVAIADVVEPGVPVHVTG